MNPADQQPQDPNQPVTSAEQILAPQQALGDPAPPSPSEQAIPTPPSAIPPLGQEQRRKLFFLMAAAFGIILLFTIGMLVRRSGTTPKPAPTPTATPTEKPTEKPTPLPTKPANPTAPAITIKTQIIPLYKFSIDMPSDWTLQEINRRPFPTGMFQPANPHDCADYTLKSTDGKSVISIEPLCDGLPYGEPAVVPNNASVIKDLGNNQWLMRYFDTESASFRYVTASERQTMTTQGQYTTERTHNGILSIGSGSDAINASVRYLYTGPEANSADPLLTADTMVKSLKSTP